MGKKKQETVELKVDATTHTYLGKLAKAADVPIDVVVKVLIAIEVVNRLEKAK